MNQKSEKETFFPTKAMEQEFLQLIMDELAKDELRAAESGVFGKKTPPRACSTGLGLCCKCVWRYKRPRVRSSYGRPRPFLQSHTTSDLQT